MASDEPTAAPEGAAPAEPERPGQTAGTVVPVSPVGDGGPPGLLVWVSAFLLVTGLDALLCVLLRPADGLDSARMLVDVLPIHAGVALLLAALTGLPSWRWLRSRPPRALARRALGVALALVAALHGARLLVGGEAPFGPDLYPADWERSGRRMLGVALLLYVALRPLSAAVVHWTPLRWLARGSLLVGVAGLAVAAGALGWWRLERLPATQARARLDTLARQPNIVIVLADTLRKDRLGFHGYTTHATSPRLDAFAADATVFENAWANSSWTIPSMASLLTGHWMIEHGASAEARVLGPTWPTLTAMLKAHGYQTMAVSSNSFINGLRQGYVTDFHRVADTSIDPGAPQRTRGSVPDPIALRSVVDAVTGWENPFFEWTIPENPGDLGVHQTTVAALAAVDDATRGDRPFFLFVDYMANHMPYQFPADFDPGFARTPRPADGEWDPVLRAASVPEYPSLLMFYWREFLAALGHETYDETDRRYLSDLYDATVAYLDQEAADLLDGLAERGLMDDTIVVFTSDHGESLGEDDDFGHGRILATQLLGVPLVVRDPAHPGGRRVSRPVQSVDLVPTLLAGLGIPQEDVSPLPLEGADLFAETAARPVVAELHYNDGPLDWDHAPALALWMRTLLKPGALVQERNLMSKTLRHLKDSTLGQRLAAWLQLFEARPHLIAEVLEMDDAALEAPFGPSLPGGTFRQFRDYCFAAQRAVITERWMLVTDSNGQRRVLDLANGGAEVEPPAGVVAELEAQLAAWLELVHPLTEPVDLTHASTIPYLR